MKSKTKYILFIILFIILISLMLFFAYSQDVDYNRNYNKIKLTEGGVSLVTKAPASSFKFNGEEMSMTTSMKNDRKNEYNSKHYDELYISAYLKNTVYTEPFEVTKNRHRFVESEIKSGKFTFKIYKIYFKKLGGEKVYLVYAICKIRGDYVYTIRIESNKDFSIEEVKPFMDIKTGMNNSVLFILIVGVLFIVSGIIATNEIVMMDEKGISTTAEIINVEKLRSTRHGVPITITVKYIDLEGNEIIAQYSMYRTINTDYFDEKIGEEIKIKYLPENKELIHLDLGVMIHARDYLRLLLGIILIYIWYSIIK